MARTFYFKPIGGIGNRWRAIKSALAFAQNQDIELCIIWPESQELNAPFSDVFRLESKASVPTVRVVNIKHRFLEPKSGFGAQLKWLLGALKKGDIPIFEHLRWQSKIKKLGRLNVVNNKHISDLFLSGIPKQNGRENFDSLQKKMEPILEVLIQSGRDFFISSCFPFYKSGNLNSIALCAPKGIPKNILEQVNNSIGIHIRGTDHRLALEKSGLNKFISRIQDHLSQHPDATFFVCSDENGVKEKLKSLFKDHLFYLDVTNFDRDNRDSILDSTRDLFLLSKTKKIFGSYGSSFSELAAHMGGIEIDVIY